MRILSFHSELTKAVLKTKLIWALTLKVTMNLQIRVSDRTKAAGQSNFIALIYYVISCQHTTSCTV
jgi:hypothetical protein